MQMIEVFAQYGLAAIIFGGFLMTLKWVFEVNNAILKDMAEERKMGMQVRQQFADRIREQTETNRAFHMAVDEAHKFQRQEHQEMIKVLGRINGYK